MWRPEVPWGVILVFVICALPAVAIGLLYLVYLQFGGK